MIDLFGRKARRERDEARRSCEMWKRDHDLAEQHIRELADIIRENDQLIHQMAMLNTWDAMRPLFNELQFGQESRMKAESNRINDIMRTELVEVYHK